MVLATFCYLRKSVLKAVLIFNVRNIENVAGLATVSCLMGYSTIRVRKLA